MLCYVQIFLYFSYLIVLVMIVLGKVNVKFFIIYRFKFQDSLKVFETVVKGEGIKVMIYCVQLLDRKLYENQQINSRYGLME